MPDQKSILDLLRKNELQVSELYSLYARKIPGCSEFWNNLAAEEIMHAREISDVYAGSAMEDIKENNFTRGVIKYVSDFVSQQIKNVKHNAISHREAIHIALRVEQSILEKKCFDMFIPNGTTVKDVMQRLNHDTDRHVKMLHQELERVSKK